MEIKTYKSKKGILLLFIIMNFAGIYLSSIFFESEFLLNIQKETRGLLDPNLIIFSFMNIVLVIFLLVFKEKIPFHALGLIRPKQGIYTFILIWFFSQVIIIGINLFQGNDLMLNNIWTRWGAGYVVGYLFAMIFGTALFEEVAFRSYLFPQFYLSIKLKNRLFWAVLLSSIIFSLWHIPSLINIVKLPLPAIAIRLVMLFVVGIISCIAYLRTGNIYVMIAIHALNNAPTPIFQSTVNPSSIIVILSLILLLIWPYLFGHSNIKEWYSISKIDPIHKN
jgi:membrane protease YdiL (CAAX protease family)